MAGTVDESGRIKAPSVPSGNSMPPELSAALAQALAGSAMGASQSQANTPTIPLWRVRPPSTPKANLGLIGDGFSPGGGRQLTGRIDAQAPLSFFTADAAASSFLDMEDKDRADFRKAAVGSGLLDPTDASPDQVAKAWYNAVSYAKDYNADRDEKDWISPWEAVSRLGMLNAAGEGGAYDPFKPRTQTQTTRRNFTKGSDAEGVTRTLESLFNEEMGRAPTQEERAIYQRLVQKAYDANPETTRSVTQTDPNGNSSTTATQSGGVDMTATLLDKVRNDPEQQAHQAGVTFFQAAMQALGAIA